MYPKTTTQDKIYNDKSKEVKPGLGNQVEKTEMM